MDWAASSAFRRQVLEARQKRVRRQIQSFQPPHLVQPLIIVSAPRAGSTLLLETLANFPELWTIGEESHEIFEGIPALHPAAHGYVSNGLGAADLTPALAEQLCDRFARQLRDRTGRLWIELPSQEQPAAVRLLEKTPKNALRIPFLQALFPDARFLFLHRTPAENIASILDGWQSRRFIAYHALPGWPPGAWSFLLTPGWEQLVGRPLVEVAVQQWRVANETILADLAALPREQMAPAYLNRAFPVRSTSKPKRRRTSSSMTCAQHSEPCRSGALVRLPLPKTAPPISAIASPRQTSSTVTSLIAAAA